MNNLKGSSKQNRIIDSFNCAIEGLIYVIKNQRNMRIHFIAGVLIFICGIALDFNRLELVCLGATIAMVLFAEMVNTTIEHTIDLISDSFHPLARIIKDISAGAVLLTTIFASIAGYLLFARYLHFYPGRIIERLAESSWHITAIAIILVLTLVVAVKITFQRGTPLRGGMPSGHSAIAFSIWTIVAFTTSNPLIIILTLGMAVLIARNRLTRNIHSIWEVIVGAVLGSLTTTLVIQAFTYLSQQR